MASNLYYFKLKTLVGEIADPKFVTDVLTDSAAEIINILDPQYLYLVSTEITGDPSDTDQTWVTSDNGYVIPSSRILNVSKKDSKAVYRQAKEVPISYEFKIQNSDSIFYPSEHEPVYILKNGAIYVYGGSAMSSVYTIKINLVEYPTVSYNDATGTGVFPIELDTSLVYSAAARVRMNQMHELRGNFPAAPSISPNYTDFDAAFDEGDIELATSALTKVTSEVQRLNAEAQSYTMEVQRYAKEYEELAMELKLFQSNFAQAMRPYVGGQSQGGPTLQQGQE